MAASGKGEKDVYKRQVKSIGTITTSNPCSEYVFLNNTSCNLSSFNAYRFLIKGEDGKPVFDADALTQDVYKRQATRGGASTTLTQR